jgi:hypothetical protein
MFIISLHRILIRAFHLSGSKSCLERLVRLLLTVTGYSSNTITPSHLIYLVELLLEVIVDVVKLASNFGSEACVKERYLES